MTIELTFESFFTRTTLLPKKRRVLGGNLRRRLQASVAVCCGVLQSVAECCRVLQGVAGCCRVLQGVAGCCRVLQGVAVSCSIL